MKKIYYINIIFVLISILTACSSTSNNLSATDNNLENHEYEFIDDVHLEPLGRVLCIGNVDICVSPDKNGTKIGELTGGEEFDYYKKVENDGFTWYRITDNGFDEMWLSTDRNFLVELNQNSDNQNQTNIINNENSYNNTSPNSDINNKDNGSSTSGAQNTDKDNSQSSSDPEYIDLHGVYVRINFSKDYIDELNITSNYKFTEVGSTIYHYIDDKREEVAPEDISSKVKWTYYTDPYSNNWRGQPTTITISLDIKWADGYEDNFLVDVQKYLNRSNNTWLSFGNDDTITFSLDEWEYAVVMISAQKDHDFE